MDRWLFPGGHVEPTDETLGSAALRELTEETGIPIDEVLPIVSEPVHIEVHPIPANPAKNEPGHRHIDFRFAFRGSSGVRKLQLDEVTDHRWTPLSELRPPLSERLAPIFDGGARPPRRPSRRTES